MQLEGGGVASGGLRELIPCIARTAVAVGIDGIFMEVRYHLGDTNILLDILTSSLDY